MHKGKKVGQEYVFGEGGFPMDVSTWKHHGDYPKHTHDFSEIAIILEGTGTMEVDDQSFSFRSGDVFVLHGNRPHAYVDTHNLTLINITCVPQMVALDRFDSGFQDSNYFSRQFKKTMGTTPSEFQKKYKWVQ